MNLKFLFLLGCSMSVFAQNNIGDFTSVTPLLGSQSKDFVIPSTHTFQKIIEMGDALTGGGTFPGSPDFTGYVPIEGSNENGYLSINNETYVGGVTILDINFNPSIKIWETTESQAIDFSSVHKTSRNCSGTVTPWNTIVSCEEATSSNDTNNDGYNDIGWCVEIDPATKTVIDKLWALGNFKHENISVHSNERTVYQGADSSTGYLYKFVADTEQDLSAGNLYVYKGSKNGAGEWIQIDNTTKNDRNTTLDQSEEVDATVFNKIEDVEVGPNVGVDGFVYFAVTGEGRVYRFQDADPITGTGVVQMETYVGDATYSITYEDGTNIVNWGQGNDNLAFDKEGNLWVLQDGGNDYIWVVKEGHTQENPQVEIFGCTPEGSEPTGITFSPDGRFLFMSLQGPSGSNAQTQQTDAAGNSVGFGKSISLVISRNGALGQTASFDNSDLKEKISIKSNPSTGEFEVHLGKIFSEVEVLVLKPTGQLVLTKNFNFVKKFHIDLSNKSSGVYLFDIKSEGKTVDVIRVIKA